MSTKVAYLGPEATFTHEAALKQFGDSSNELVPMRTIPDIFMAVEKGEVEFGVVPIENSIEGAVTYTLDMFGRPDLDDIVICAEIMLPISQNLMSAKNGPATLQDIKLIYSHPQSIAQSRKWLEANLPQVELVEVNSNALAAKMAADKPESAAIGPRLCVDYYNLKLMEANVHDADFNQTRFLVIYKQKPRWPVPVFEAGDNGQPMSAIMLSIKDRVGALHAVTGVFSRYNLNMNRIESRPSKQKAWDYVFFIDFEGQPTQPHVAAALRDLATETTWAKVLGWWIRAR